MSTITEALAAAKQPPKQGIVKWLETLDKADRDALTAAASDPGIPTRAIYDIAKANGCSVGREKIAEWRKANGLNR